MADYKITECTNCNYRTKCQKVEYTGQNNELYEGYLCDVCLKNYQAENVFAYPSLHLEDGDIIKMIAWGINYLRDEIEKGDKNGRRKRIL